MNIQFKKEIKEFIDYCENHNIDIYLVGGAVRDHLLNIETYDYDFALSSDYYQALTILSNKYNCKRNDNYQAIKMKLGEYNLEISHCRQEADSLDSRHPKTIRFINDIKEDSKRRDFTINALYYKNGKIYDFYNGIKDLEDKTLTVIGDTSTRFKEDSLRILRMIRFSCNEFNIKDQDSLIILNSNELISKLSMDRFNSEFDKILLSKNINVITRYKIIFEKYFNIQFNDLNQLTNLDTLSEMKTYLGIKNDSLLYKYRDIKIPSDLKELNKLIYKYSKDDLKELIIYYDKINKTNIIDNFNKIISDKYYNKNQLDINVKELISLIQDKTKIKFYLDFISYAIIDEKIANKKEEIIKYIMESKNENII